jgi:hypothetical protein
MAAQGDISNKDLESRISKIPKFNGSLNAGETSEIRREHYIRWRNGVIKVLNLRGYGELLPQEDLLEVIPDDTEEVEEVTTAATEGEGAAAEEKVESEETTAARKARMRKMESPALAIISLSLQSPASDWVDYMIAAKTKFAEIWASLKSLYGVSSEVDEIGVLESLGALRLSGHEDPVKFYMKL